MRQARGAGECRIASVPGVRGRVIAGANHSLMVPGDWNASLETLGTVAEACNGVVRGVRSRSVRCQPVG